MGKCGAFRVGVKEVLSSFQLVPAISNASTAYNLVIINFVLIILHLMEPNAGMESVASASLAGAVVGQLVFGAVGDLVGRHKGLILTLATTFIGSVLSFTVPQPDQGNEMTVLAVTRFFLGIGVGGVYPLSATAVAESSGDHGSRGRAVALTFSFQGWGQVLAPFISYVVLVAGVPFETAWRLLLAIGAIPAALPLLRHIRAVVSENYYNLAPGVSEDEEEVAVVGTTATPSSQRGGGNASWAMIRSILRRGSLVRPLIGCAGGWFVFDVIFYGNMLFAPLVLAAAFGLHEHADDDGLDNARAHVTQQAGLATLLAVIALPGYYLSVVYADSVGRRNIQMMGFGVMAALFGILGLCFDWLRSHAPMLLLLLYGLSFTFTNFGPNATTFILPSEMFPAEIRSVTNGFCAAMGKVGATVGVLIFKPLLDRHGSAPVLLGCGVLSLLGLVITHLCIDDRRGKAMAELGDQTTHPDTHLAGSELEMVSKKLIVKREGGGGGGGGGGGIA